MVRNSNHTPEEQRNGLFSGYINEVSKSPHKLIKFNLDGILEIFLTLKEEEKEILVQSINKIISELNVEYKRKLMLVIPDNAKKHLNF